MFGLNIYVVLNFAWLEYFSKHLKEWQALLFAASIFNETYFRR